MKPIPLLGWLVFGFCTLSWLSTYGRQWDFSGGMPTTLLSPDGKTYRDGAPIDGLSLAIATSGHEQEASLVLMVVLLVLVAAAPFQIWRFVRLQQKAFERELRRIQGHDKHEG
jgi:hypothetical protein